MLGALNPLTRDANDFGAVNNLVGLGGIVVVEGANTGAPSIQGETCQRMLAFDFSGTGGMPAINANEQLFRLPPLPEGTENPVLYRQRGPRDWVRADGQQVVQGAIFLDAPVNGYYRVFASVLNRPFAFGDIHVDPNPVHEGVTPILRVGIGKVQDLSTRIYDISGDLVFEARIDTEIKVIHGKPTYEYPLDPTRFKSGVYLGVVTAIKDGKETIRQHYRFTVVR